MKARQYFYRLGQQAQSLTGSMSISTMGACAALHGLSFRNAGWAMEAFYDGWVNQSGRYA